jgi:hypothetical protein
MKILAFLKSNKEIFEILGVLCGVIISIIALIQSCQAINFSQQLDYSIEADVLNNDSLIFLRPSFTEYAISMLTKDQVDKFHDYEFGWIGIPIRVEIHNTSLQRRLSIDSANLIYPQQRTDDDYIKPILDHLDDPEEGFQFYEFETMCFKVYLDPVQADCKTYPFKKKLLALDSGSTNETYQFKDDKNFQSSITLPLNIDSDSDKFLYVYGFQYVPPEEFQRLESFFNREGTHSMADFRLFNKEIDRIWEGWGFERELDIILTTNRHDIKAITFNLCFENQCS